MDSYGYKLLRNLPLIVLLILFSFTYKSYAQSVTVITGPGTANVGDTKQYKISGFVCPDDPPGSPAPYYLIQISGPPVTITKPNPIGAPDIYEVTFHGCGTVVLEGLRPCQNFVPGTKTIVVSGTATNASISSAPTALCSGSTYNFSATPTGGTWSVSGGGSINSSGVYTAPTVGTPTNVTVTYDYQPSDPTYCASQDVVSFVVNPSPAAPTASSQSFCGSTTVGNLVPSGGGIQWYSGSTGGSPLAGGTSITSSGTYYVQQTVNGCDSPRTPVSITINPIPVAPTASNQSFCGNATVANLTASGSNTQWYANASGGSPLSNGTVLTNGGTYYVQQTVNGCDSPRTPVTVTITPIPPAPTASNQSFCGSGTIGNLTPSGAGYTWHADASTPGILLPGTVLTNGSTYYVQQTVNGCASPRTPVTVTINPIPAAPTASNQSFCGSGTVANLTPSGVGYTWHADASTPGILLPGTVLINGGTYYVQQTVNGCASPRTPITVTIDSPVNAGVISGLTEVCVGQLINLSSNGDSGGTWSVNNGNASVNNGNVTGINGGSVVVSYTVNGNGACPNDVATYTITVNTLPNVTLSKNDITCNGMNDGSATVTVTGNGGFSYVWTPNVSTGSTATGLASGSYTVLVTDINGCSHAESINITEPTAIVLTPTSTPASCGNSDGTATVSATGGAGGYTYSWDDSMSQSTSTAVNLAAGTYQVTVEDADGCTNTQIVAVANMNGPTVSISTQQNVNCSDDTNGSVTIQATGGTGNYTYTWLPNVGTTNSASDLGVGDYLVTVIDDAGCETPITISIIANNPTPTVSANALSTSICEGQDIQLQGSVSDGGSSPIFQWTGPNGFSSLSQNPIITNATPNASGDYNFVVTGDGGCTSSSTQVTVTVNAKPTANASANEISVCEGGTIMLQGSGGVSYQWTGPNGFTSTDQNPTISNAAIYESGTYTLIVISGNGCESDSASVNIIVNPSAPSTNYIETTLTVCAGETVVLSVNNPDSTLIYSWVFDENNIGQGLSMTLSPVTLDDRGAYLIYVAENAGCNSLAEVIKLNVETCDIVIPEAFSPNGDGINDFFHIDNIELYPNTELWIYSRWGLEVFYSDNYKNDWDGTSQNKLNVGKDILPEGTYYYYLKLGEVNGESNSVKEFKGFVYLKR
ncbi:MAG: gliding motility-associated C-terminal domain-containing protein [Brumimicrobium sp.]|nr:gliding motility-associated C-terminal domain-containing protein [Brumimicrobium sp.]